MKRSIKILSILTVGVILSACSSDEPKPSDTLLSDYKEKQLEKAKEVEETMNKRVDEINKQLDTQKKDEDEPSYLK